MKKSAATSIRIWGRTSGRAFGFLAALAAGLAFSVPASADWHGGHGDSHHGGFHHDHFHGRVFLGFGSFWPYYDPFFYPYPAYYSPPYYSPPYYRVPYGAPAATISPQANCIRFNGDATNDQTGQPFYGTACMQADGKWHIVGN